MPVAGALGWGALAASSLVLGALIGLARPWPERLVGLVLAFGAGALISAVSFELAEDGVEIGGPGPVAVGMTLGALAFYVLDGVVERRSKGSGAGSALALGAFLDGIPEQFVLGLGLATGGGVSVGLLAAIFVSNVPEAVGSASAMRAGGRDRGTILRMWIVVAVVCALASGVGFGIADSTGDRARGRRERLRRRRAPGHARRLDDPRRHQAGRAHHRARYDAWIRAGVRPVRDHLGARGSTWS